jgi:tRNA nucleotidyltransferase (CCA-adding enzyme)
LIARANYKDHRAQCPSVDRNIYHNRYTESVLKKSYEEILLRKSCAEHQKNLRDSRSD